MFRLTKKLAAILVLLSSSHALAAGNYSYHYAQVISVTDGDSIRVRMDNRPVMVRLADIDAPEKEQEFGMKSRQYLGNLLFGKQVRIMTISRVSNSQIIGRVYLDNMDVSADLVRKGYAWAAGQGRSDPAFLRLETEARNFRRGLWAGVPVPPWQWRGKHPGP